MKDECRRCGKELDEQDTHFWGDGLDDAYCSVECLEEAKKSRKEKTKKEKEV